MDRPTTPFAPFLSPRGGGRESRCAAVAAMLLAAAGCAPLNVPLSEVLPRHRMSPQAVALDIMTVSLPDDATSEALWNQIDEQQLTPDQRRRLEQAGLRVGLIAGQMPVELERVLGITSTPDDRRLPQAVATDDETAAQIRHMQLRLGGDHHGTILASSVHEELPLLCARQGRHGAELTGQTYRQAQGEFRVAARQLDDGRISVEMTPELVHGDVGMQYTATDGVLRPQPGRPKIVYDELKCSLPMAAGQMLVVGPSAERRGALGQAFLSQQIGGRPHQKLLIVRLAQTQFDALFDEPLPTGSVPQPWVDEEASVELPSAEALDSPLDEPLETAEGTESP